ncbi:hypothetical protein ACFQZQ_10815 [Lysobacter koreensis]|uniref:DUF2834 domain-containing protein n=1 Tax=Lysobacter koreensis TaxID=266122 RepID=A0ABW2YTG6_9GAMM
MSKDNAAPLVSLALLASAVFYLWAISGPPRMLDGGLTGEEMSFGEKAFVLLVALSVFASMFVALRRAARAGSKFWFFVCLFLWPAAYLYTLVVSRADER